MLWSKHDGIGPKLVLVHGFTQNHQCWGDLVVEMSVDHEVITVDAPGHGHSSNIAVDLFDGAALLGETGGQATYLGYSMGARLCLHLALAQHHLVNALILISANGGIEDEILRQDRSLIDEIRANQLETKGLDAFLDAWLKQPMFESLPEHVRFFEARSTNTAAGLASSLRLAGTGSQEPTWNRLHTLTMPVLIIAGKNDPAYVSQAEQLSTAIGANATVELIANAGHAVHLEQPEAFLAVIRPWLNSLT
ncbi:MAG: alpha/beta fold hydrolase [Acidimicrobiales bacterium]